MSDPLRTQGMTSSAALLALALFVGGCGSPGAEPPGTTPPVATSEDAGPPAPTTAAVEDPKLRLEVEIRPRPGVEALSLDMVSIQVRVTSQDPADLQIPGPPALTLEVRPEGGGDALPVRPHALRPPPPKRFPLSVEAGETIELGPMDLGHFDLDPLRVRGGEVYRVVARYRAGPEAQVHEVLEVLELAPASVEFPFSNPLDEAPPVRGAVPLRVRDADGAVRDEYLWSPDTGLEVPEDEDEDSGEAASGDS